MADSNIVGTSFTTQPATPEGSTLHRTDAKYAALMAQGFGVPAAAESQEPPPPEPDP